MKKMIAICLMAMSMFSASAAGIYDGIYQSTTNSRAYLSVHQSGSILIAAAFTTINTSGVRYSTSGGSVTPPTSNIWAVYQGGISGNAANLIGQDTYEACSTSVDIVFSQSYLTLTQTASRATALGINQGVNCAEGNGESFILNRAF